MIDGVKLIVIPHKFPNPRSNLRKQPAEGQYLDLRTSVTALSPPSSFSSLLPSLHTFHLLNHASIYISFTADLCYPPPPLPSIPLDKTGHTVAIMGVDQPGPLLTCSIHRLKLSHSCSPSTSQSCMSSLLLVHISPKISKSMQHSDGTWGN